MTSYPARQERVEPNFAGRDFARGHGWGLPPAGQGQLPRSAGVVALLATSSDRPDDWVGTGQALQRVLLYLSACGIAAALDTQPLEITGCRNFVRLHFADGAPRRCCCALALPISVRSASGGRSKTSCSSQREALGPAGSQPFSSPSRVSAR